MNEQDTMKLTLACGAGGLHTQRSGQLEGSIENWEHEEYCCEKIRIYIPVGTEDNDLFLNNGEVVIETEDSEWKINKHKTGGPDGQKVLELLTADGGMRPLKNPLRFTVYGRVGPCEGESSVTFEYFIRKKQETDFYSKERVFTFQKTPGDFYLRNFMAADEKSPLSIRTEFEPDTPIYFSWESNATGYELYASVEGSTTLVSSGQGTSCLYQNGIGKDTTFFLRVFSTSSRTAAKKKNARRELYGALTLTTGKQCLAAAKISEKFEAKNADTIAVFGTGSQLDAPGSGQTKKAEAGTDGFIMGHLLCQGEAACTPSSAFIRVSVYAKEEKGYHEQYTMQEYAYRGMLSGENGSTMLNKPANICIPVAKGNRVVMECSNCSGGYRALWEFLPMGGAKLQEV